MVRLTASNGKLAEKASLPYPTPYYINFLPLIILHLSENRYLHFAQDRQQIPFDVLEETESIRYGP